MGKYRSRSRSHSPARRKHYDEPLHRRRDRRSPAPSGLLVRNISLSARPEDLRVPFERYGPIKDVYLPKNYHTGEPRGFGFVKFRYAEDAAEAKAHLNCTVIGGREIKIVFAEENRKTPQEMRKVLRTSGPSARGSYRRHSSPRFPSRRYHSYSRSASPARRDSRDRDHENHDDYYSPKRSRSKSRSISPRDERNCRSKGRSSRQSRPMSRSNSPHIQEKSRFSMSPRDNSQIAHDVDSASRRRKSPGRNADSSARSCSRSYRFVKISTFVKHWAEMAMPCRLNPRPFDVLVLCYISSSFIHIHAPILLCGSKGPLWKHYDAAARISILLWLTVCSLLSPSADLFGGPGKSICNILLYHWTHVNYNRLLPIVTSIMFVFWFFLLCHSKPMRLL